LEIFVRRPDVRPIIARFVLLPVANPAPSRARFGFLNFRFYITPSQTAQHDLCFLRG
jgi:hypothetical protein